MRIEYSRQFIRQFRRCDDHIQEQFQVRQELFFKNPFHPLLRNHALGGKLVGYRSFNVTEDWRVIFKEVEDEGMVFFVEIGTHSQLYK